MNLVSKLISASNLAHLSREPEKRLYRLVMTTTATGTSRENHLFHTRDSRHGCEFLVHTDVEITIIPPTSGQQQTQSFYQLQAANGIEIDTYDGKLHAINFGIFPGYLIR